MMSGEAELLLCLPVKKDADSVRPRRREDEPVQPQEHFDNGISIGRFGPSRVDVALNGGVLHPFPAGLEELNRQAVPLPALRGREDEPHKQDH
jgi:hypothetical protein